MTQINAPTSLVLHVACVKYTILSPTLVCMRTDENDIEVRVECNIDVQNSKKMSSLMMDSLLCELMESMMKEMIDMRLDRNYKAFIEIVPNVNLYDSFDNDQLIWQTQLVYSAEDNQIYVHIVNSIEDQNLVVPAAKFDAGLKTSI